MSITIDTYQPIDNKNTEEYRSNLLITIDRLKAKEQKLFNELYVDNTSSGTWKLLAIISGIVLVIVLIFNHSNTRETLLGISIIGLILGIYQTNYTTREEKRLSILLDGAKKEVEEVQKAYDYAIKYKDHETIYEPNSGYLYNKKIFTEQNL